MKYFQKLLLLVAVLSVIGLSCNLSDQRSKTQSKKPERKADFTLSSAVLSRRVGNDFEDAFRGMNGRTLAVYGRLLEVATENGRATFHLEGDGVYKDIKCVTDQSISSVAKSTGQPSVIGKLDIRTSVFGGKTIIDSVYVTLTDCELVKLD